ncbi:Amino-acid acetyltransferase, mitochondrial [Sorochytrium milnesiophthora]
MHLPLKQAVVVAAAWRRTFQSWSSHPGSQTELFQDAQQLLSLGGQPPTQREVRNFVQRYELLALSDEHQLYPQPLRAHLALVLWRLPGRIANERTDGHDHDSDSVTWTRLRAVARELVLLKKLNVHPLIVLHSDAWRDERQADLRMHMFSDSAHVAALLRGDADTGGGKPVSCELLQVRDDLPQRSVDVNMHNLRRVLNPTARAPIPVIVPLAQSVQDSRHTVVRAQDAVTALAQVLGPDSSDGSHITAQPEDASDVLFAQQTCELSKFIILDTRAEDDAPLALPTDVPFINLAAEYSEYHAKLTSAAQDAALPARVQSIYRTAADNLELAHQVLGTLPSTASALITRPGHHQPSSALVRHMVTDKPLAATFQQPQGATATVLRRGLAVAEFSDMQDSRLDMDRLLALLEQSFGRRLDRDAFLARLFRVGHRIILAGDYTGAAIVTNECRTSPPQPLYYLDKFAVHPAHQAVGIADILWRQLQTRYPSLSWRSRSDNLVNRWYFDRATGSMRCGRWTLLWYGDDGLSRLDEHIDVVRAIPPSFL